MRAADAFYGLMTFCVIVYLFGIVTGTTIMKYYGVVIPLELISDGSHPCYPGQGPLDVPVDGRRYQC